MSFLTDSPQILLLGVFNFLNVWLVHYLADFLLFWEFFCAVALGGYIFYLWATSAPVMFLNNDVSSSCVLLSTRYSIVDFLDTECLFLARSICESRVSCFKISRHHRMFIIRFDLTCFVMFFGSFSNQRIMYFCDCCNLMTYGCMYLTRMSLCDFGRRRHIGTHSHSTDGPRWCMLVGMATRTARGCCWMPAPTRMHMTRCVRVSSKRLRFWRT